MFKKMNIISTIYIPLSLKGFQSIQRRLHFKLFLFRILVNREQYYLLLAGNMLFVWSKRRKVGICLPPLERNS